MSGRGGVRPPRQLTRAFPTMTRHIASRHFVLVALGLSLVAAPALAQQQPTSTLRGSNPRGIFLGAHLVGARIDIDEGENSDNAADDGGGLGLQLGYGFRNNLALFIDLTGTRMRPEEEEEADEYNLGHVDLGVRYHFASPSRALMPYVEAAFTGRAATQEGTIEHPETGEPVDAEIEIRGTAFTFGGGLQYFASPRFALNAGVRFSTGPFDNVKFKIGDTSIEVEDLDIDATSTRLNLGFVWYPKAR
jgi:opacity protein-like surface antigen